MDNTVMEHMLDLVDYVLNTQVSYDELGHNKWTGLCNYMLGCGLLSTDIDYEGSYLIVGPTYDRFLDHCSGDYHNQYW